MRKANIKRVNKGVNIKLFAVLVIVVCIFLMATIKVNGNDKTVKDKNYYAAFEKTFTEVIKANLKEEGYINCGINVSCVIKPYSDREYKVRIHHNRISMLDENEKSILLSKLDSITFPYEECNIKYEFFD